MGGQRHSNNYWLRFMIDFSNKVEKVQKLSIDLSKYHFQVKRMSNSFTSFDVPNIHEKGHETPHETRETFLLSKFYLVEI